MVIEQKNIQKQEEKNLLNTSVLFKTSKQVSNPSPSKKSKSQSTGTAISPNLALGYQSRPGVGSGDVQGWCRAVGQELLSLQQGWQGLWCWGLSELLLPCSVLWLGSSQLGSELTAPHAAKCSSILWVSRSQCAVGAEFVS